MISKLSGSIQQFLADLDRTQAQLLQAQAEVSSGLRVQQPSDDPAAIAEILQIQGDIAQNQQVQSNLGTAKTEVDTADTALQSAVQLVENALSLAVQGGNSATTATQRTDLASKTSDFLGALVGISTTTVNGRYIFSGDQDDGPAYQLDASQPNGVKQLLSGPSTRVIVGVDGTAITVSKTAQEIFDAHDANGAAAAGNVFAAISALQKALASNDQAGILQAADSLRSADSYLNSQLAFYGSTQNRIENATGLAQKFQLQEQAGLSRVRDADVPALALQISQDQVQQQASLAVQAKVTQSRNLFDYLA